MALIASSLSGCGLYVPEKDLLASDAAEPPAPSVGGMTKNNVIAHIRCEIRNGLWKASHLPNVGWLADYGTVVQLKTTWDEQSQLNSSLSWLTPLAKAQTFALGVGARGSAHSTRTETIQFTLANAELLDEQRRDLATGDARCGGYQKGVMIEGDLRIDQFVYDNAVAAGAAGEATTKAVDAAPYSIFQDQLTFVAAVGGGLNPTWRFVRVTLDPGSPVLDASRSSTNDVIVTVGPLAKGPAGSKSRQVSAETRAVHDSALYGSSTATSIQSLTR